MKIVEQGVLQQAQPGTARANLTFPTVTALADGTLLATWRAGSTKDGPDETIEFARSTDGGATWGPAWTAFDGWEVDGLWGTLKLCYLTELAPDRLLAAAMWVDRTTYGSAPLFNAETEGCLSMAILLAESTDQGASWSTWRRVPMPDFVGPPSLTAPVLQLADGTLAMSIETNKHYDDPGPWRQKVLFFHSIDGGQTWPRVSVAGEDPAGRIFNWDLRCGVGPNGRVVSFAWTYDSVAGNYLPIHRRVSVDNGQTWGEPEPLDFADQAARPAILADGRVVLAYVDRFGSRTIRAQAAPSVDGTFDAAGQITLYAHVVGAGPAPGTDGDMGELLSEMGLWTFGLPYGEVLPDGDVLVVYYAGNEQALDLHWSRVAI